MIEYGNARVAALRARLLDGATLLRLEDARSAWDVLAILERAEDWRSIIRDVGPLVGDPAAAVEAAVERHRTVRLGRLPAWYEPPLRGCVEALVLPLDLERLLAVLRRRHGGEDPEAVAAGLVGGAVLDAATLGRIARAPDVVAAVGLAAAAGAVDRPTTRAVREAIARDGSWTAVETAIVDGAARARAARTAGRGTVRAAVREVLAAEAAVRSRSVGELDAAGAATAAALERDLTLARLDALARLARRDPLGIGAIAGYVAAVESQAIRIRAALARASGGWSAHRMVPYRAGARV